MIFLRGAAGKLNKRDDFCLLSAKKPRGIREKGQSLKKRACFRLRKQ